MILFQLFSMQIRIQILNIIFKGCKQAENLGDACHSVKIEINRYLSQQEYYVASAETIAHFILNELSSDFLNFMNEKSCQINIKLALLCQQAWLANN